MPWVLAMLTVVAGSLAMPATASVVFTDNTFNLADYTIDTFQSGGATVDITQTLTSGNPGSALQIITNVPAHSSTFFATQYFLNSSFLYNPGTQGAIQSIDFISDTYVGTSASLIARGDAPILFQGGNYYINSISLATVNGTWLTGSVNGLQATDFSLVTDLLTLATNASINPDFTSGMIQFGAIAGVFDQGTAATTWDGRRDNLSYTVNAVPIPAAVWLFGSGLLGLVSMARRKKA